ncbi:MAG: type II secretion system inner membrane protein GspF [Candidatus Brocadiae bacterium]|nr:type II secretion system inner membrane protein GspF [Candidatus Brocadiia bacterium]
MPVFSYKALKESGDIAAGVIDADSPRDARSKLRMQALHVTQLEPIVQGASAEQQKRRSLFLPKFASQKSTVEIALITRQLATLLNAGTPLNEALRAIVEQTNSRKLEAIIRDIRERISQGATFADALGNHPGYFSDLYVNMVRSGEASGTLDEILKRLADYLHQQNRLAGKVMAAMTYPLVMVVVGTGVVTFLLGFVVPRILDVLSKQKIVMPLPTMLLVAVTNILRGYWPLLLGGLIASWIGFKLYTATPGGRRVWDGFILRIPVLGDLFRKAAISRFSTTLSTLLGSGLPVMEALSITQKVMGNVVLGAVIDKVRARVMEGSDISAPLKQSKLFPPTVCYMVAIGEESGQLEEMLRRVSQSYDEEIELTTQKVTSLIEPIMIVLMAVVVGFIVLAVLLPILDLSNL